MFSFIKRMAGVVTVEEINGQVRVEGIRADVMAKDIANIFGTNRINNNIFTHQDESSFSFPSYFAPDVYFILRRLTQEPSIRVSVRTLSKIRNGIAEKTWFSKTFGTYPCRLNLNKLKDLTLSPLDFQLDFAKTYDQKVQAYGLKGYLFAATAGSGKTFTSLMMAHLYECDVVLVVCPSNAVQQVWEKNIQNRFKTPQRYWHSRMSHEPRGDERFIVCHYEALDKMMLYARRHWGKKIMVILDESHNLNEVSSKRTNTFIELCKETKAEHVIWLSGTPIKALPKESIPLFRCIDPLFTPDAEERFKKIFGSSNTRGVEILNNRLGIVTYLVEKSQLNLLKPIFKDVKIKIPNSDRYTLESVKKAMRDFVQERAAYYKAREPQDKTFFYGCLDDYRDSISSKPALREEYEHYRKCLKVVIASGGDYSAKAEIMFCNKFENTKLIPWMSQDRKARFKDVRSVIKYVGLKIQGECLGRIVGGLRTQCHIDMVGFVDFVALCESTEKKVVVFTSYVGVVEKGIEIMRQRGLNPIAVYGKTSANLNSLVSQFGADPSLDPLIATYKSLSTAVPLTMCDTAVMLDAPFRDYVLQQAVSRVHRLDADSKTGQTQTYVYTVCLDTGDEPNISSRSFDILRWSQEQVEAIVGIKSPFELKDNPEDMTMSMESEHCLIEEVIDDALTIKANIPAYMRDW